MNMLAIDNSHIRYFIYYSLPVLMVGIVSRAFPFISFLYYAVPVILFLYIAIVLISIKRTEINLNLMLILSAFPVYCLITSLWSEYPLISLQRSLYLILLYAGIFSAVFLYKKYYPEKGIEFFIPANIFILFLSLISLIFNIPENSWTGGNGLGFMGFAGHQNTLASALLFTIPAVFAKLRRPVKSEQLIVKSNEKISTNYKPLTTYYPLVGLLITANCLLITLTYSRASILALAFGCLVFLILTRSYKTLAAVFTLASVVIVLFFTFQPINHSLNQWLHKDGGSVLGRRMILWQPSQDAANLGGVFGLGYGVSAPEIKTPVLTGSHYEDRRYVREKGNSTLALIEETGLMGLILFLLPLFLIVRRKTKDDRWQKQMSDSRSPTTNYLLPTTYYLLPTLAALLLHSQFEAWWVGVGSIQLPLFIFYIGLLVQSSRFQNR